MRTRIKSAVRCWGVVALAQLAASCGGGGGGDDGGSPSAAGGQWSIPTNFVIDGGPGKDGIPALVSPRFESAAKISTVQPDDLVLVVWDGDQVKVYPEDVLDWHEVVNDTGGSRPFILSYCPLTASAVAWVASPSDADPTFGVSGLLYNSNLLLYDRKTDSRWSQMLQSAVSGSRIGEEPVGIPVIETTFATLKSMYPDAVVLTRETGHFRDYDRYPYGDYRSSGNLLFPVQRRDNRLHEKERAIGVHSGRASKVYQLAGFGPNTQAINDDFSGEAIVVVGNSAKQFAAVYSRELNDGSILAMTPLEDALPNVMTDSEGNVWDIFGRAVAGPRLGTQLRMVKSYTAMWFAWTAHFDTVEIYF